MNHYNLCKDIWNYSDILIPLSFFSGLCTPYDEFLLLTIPLMSISIISILFKGKTKEIKELNLLYQEFLKNYHHLNEHFELKDPILLQTMFVYLLRHGYLSKDKNFQCTGEKFYDLPHISGVEIFLGDAVCRHIATMFRDILRIEGWKSDTFSCYQRTKEVWYEPLTEFKHTEEELQSWISKELLNVETQKKFYQILKQSIEANIPIEFYSRWIDDKFFGKRYGNHLICFSQTENHSYFLDPSQNRYYQYREEKNKKILYDDYDDRILLKKKQSYGDYFINEEFYHDNTKSFVTFEEAREKKNDMNQICEKEQEYFQKFYLENKEIYKEIADKMLKLKK